MSVIPGEPTNPSDPLAESVLLDGPPPKQSLKSLGLRRLLATLPLAVASFTIFWGAVQSILIPLQVQRIDATAQNSALSLIVGIGAISSMVAAPIAGALTDRTRSRIGGRAPWMIVGAVATLGLAIAMATSSSIPLIIVLFVLIQFTTNLILTPVSAYIPDRVPVSRRGVFSAAYGAAQLVGGVIGQSLGSVFSDKLFVGYLVVAVVLVVLVVLFSLVNARSNLGEPKEPLSVRAILETFWVNPKAHPNFAWAFTGRFLLFVGYFPLQTFLLYLLQDYIGLHERAVTVIPTLGLATLVGTLVGSVAGGLIAQRIGRTKPVIYVATALLVVGLALPLIWPTVDAMIIYSALSGLGVGTYISVDLLLITLVLPSAENAGKDLGIINITTTLPQTIGVVLGGAAIALFGSYAALLPTAIVAALLGAVALSFIRGVK